MHVLLVPSGFPNVNLFNSMASLFELQAILLQERWMFAN